MWNLSNNHITIWNSPNASCGKTIVSQVFTVLVTCHWNPVEPQKTDGETIRNPRKHKYEISYNLKSLADLPK